MATISGTITRRGAGAPGLRVVATTEVRIGIPIDPKPCVTSLPQIREVGSGTTDGAGRYRITFTAPERPEFACRYIATVSVAVFDGLVLLWRSAKSGIGPAVRFDHELEPEDTDDGEPGGGFVRGRITECGHGTSEYRVVAFQETRIRFEDVKQTVTSTKRLGDEFPDADGVYSISFRPTVFPDGVDDARVTAYIQVLLGALKVWQSPKRLVPESGLVGISHDLYPDCPAGSTRVRVVDDTGRRVPGAEIYVNGVTAGVTDVAGQAFVPAAAGDRLVARKLLHEQESPRNDHGRNSHQNWSYRVYITSLNIEHDQNGDDVIPVAYVVADPAARHDLQVRRRNTLVGYNLRCSLEWDAGADILRYRDALAEASELLYNGMDGQFLIEQVELSDDGTFWDETDIKVYARRNRKGEARLGGLWGDDGYILVNPYDGQSPDTLLHELGHYALDVNDEYKEGDDWDDDNGNPRCTLQSTTPGTPFSDRMSKDSCFMSGTSARDIPKLCSDHPDNPHAKGTKQGDRDCWSAVAERYGDQLRRWWLLTPVTRGAIPDRFPDSGIPSSRTTPSLEGSVDIESYIPVSGWRPRFFTRDREREDLIEPFLRCRCVFESDPMDGVTVRLLTSYGRSYEAGLSAAKDFPDGTTTSVGEVLVRGAHVGDRLSAMRDSSDPVFFLNHTITEADRAAGVVTLLGRAEDQPTQPVRVSVRPREIGTVEVSVIAPATMSAEPLCVLRESAVAEPSLVALERVSEERYSARLTGLPAQFTRTFTVSLPSVDGMDVSRSVVFTGILLDPDKLTSLRSPDGQLDVVIRRGSLDVPTQVLCVSEPLQRSTGQRLDVLAGPYRLALAGDALFSRPALLYARLQELDFPSRSSDKPPQIWSFDSDAGRWRALGGMSTKLVARASTRGPGLLAIARLAEGG